WPAGRGRTAATAPRPRPDASGPAVTPAGSQDGDRGGPPSRASTGTIIGSAQTLTGSRSGQEGRTAPAKTRWAPKQRQLLSLAKHLIAAGGSWPLKPPRRSPASTQRRPAAPPS